MALVQADFLGVDTPSTITQSIHQQLSEYRYTFLMTLNVSTYFLGESQLTPVQNNPISVVLMCTKLYRNLCIIGVIWDSYFLGSIHSFAYQHRAH